MNQEFKDLVVEFNRFVPSQLAEKFAEEGIVKEIILRQNNLPTDIEDRIGIKDAQVVVKGVKVIIKVEGVMPSSAKKYLKGKNADFFEIPEELKVLGFGTDTTTSVRINIQGTTRTIDVSDTGKIKPYFNIDDEAKKSTSGHPVKKA